MKLNFKHFSIPSGIKAAECITGDARESFANIIYQKMNGIRAHALSFKIYGSDGAIDYSESEIQLIIEVAENYCTPAFIDGLRAQMHEYDFETKRK